jgi:competence protein ComEC
VWVIAGLSIDMLLGLAHLVASSRGAVAMMAAMPPWALGLMISGGLWLCLWTSWPRVYGLLPIALGATGAAMSPTPDVLITGDGRHLALVDGDGTPLLLRERSGEFIRSVFADSAGFDDEPEELASRRFASCSRDSCIAIVERGGRPWHILATRSAQSIEWAELVKACGAADIVVSSRWLPRHCSPRWLKLDRDSLAKTGGVAVYLSDTPRSATVAGRIGKHPWAADVPKRTRYGRSPRNRENRYAPVRNRA